MTVKERIAYYSLGFVGEQYLPSIGLQAIKENYSTENFIILAGMSDKDNPFELREYFSKAIEENKIPIPQKSIAVQTIVKWQINHILKTNIDIYEGCKKIEELLDQTQTEWETLDLWNIYLDYISLWEEISDGLQMRSKGESKQEYILKTKKKIKLQFEAWLENVA